LNGCFTTGLYLEGASWNDQDGVLQESEPKVLFTKMPIIHFIPELEKEVTIEVIEAP
jgi:dynein heavy chain, axonemal